MLTFRIGKGHERGGGDSVGAFNKEIHHITRVSSNREMRSRQSSRDDLHRGIELVDEVVVIAVGFLVLRG